MSNLFPSNRDFFFSQPSVFDRAFDSFFPKMNHPSSDIVEKENGYEVKMDIPGMKKEDIHVTYNNNVLTVEASQRQAMEDKDESTNFIHRERMSRSFRRQFVLNNVQADMIQCKYEDGVLAITLPKNPQQSTDENHRIQIQ
ncbi:Hsp20/alpha crystallin family protein [Rummeliibacillus sp. SL167]|uniref:Hsp20/alpha crystallin family protein n=1 Tax=Rummeliibacillus sp. SL167 TaxID=2579792 RepID=UPI0011B3E4B1|nr:Hsp20/alpha crystallin family protein [Rummeliibacillus sp. SL167]